MKKILRKKDVFSWRQLLSIKNYTTVVEYDCLSFIQDKPDIISRVVFLPVLNLILFGAGLSGIITGAQQLGGHHYLIFIFPGIVGQGLVTHATVMIYQIISDRNMGLQAFKMASGTGVLAYVLGSITLPVFIFIIQNIIAILSLLLCSTPLPSSCHILLTLLVAALCACLWSLFAILISCLVTDIKKAQLLTSLFVLPIVLSAPTFFPLDSAPQYLQTISIFNPLTYQVRALRAAFLEGTVPIMLFAMTIALILICLFATTYMMGKKVFLSPEN